MMNLLLGIDDDLYVSGFGIFGCELSCLELLFFAGLSVVNFGPLGNYR